MKIYAVNTDGSKTINLTRNDVGILGSQSRLGFPQEKIGSIVERDQK